jgi:hypothetical protein
MGYTLQVDMHQLASYCWKPAFKALLKLQLPSVQNFPLLLYKILSILDIIKVIIYNLLSFRNRQGFCFNAESLLVSAHLSSQLVDYQCCCQLPNLAGGAD